MSELGHRPTVAESPEAAISMDGPEILPIGLVPEDVTGARILTPEEVRALNHPATGQVPEGLTLDEIEARLLPADELPKELKTRKRYPITRKAGALLLAASAAILPSAIAGTHSHAPHTKVTHAAPAPTPKLLQDLSPAHPFPSFNQTTFPAIPQSAYAEAERLVDAPPDAAYEQVYRDFSLAQMLRRPFGPFGAFMSTEQMTEQEFEANNAVAQEYGLKVVDPARTVSALSAMYLSPLEGDPTPLIDRAYAEAQDYLAKLDVHLSWAQPEEKFYWGVRPPQPGDLSPRTVVGGLESIVQDLSLMPPSFMKDVTGGQGLNLEIGGNPKAQAVAYADMGGQARIVVDLSYDFNRGTILHEFTHTLDAKEGGGAAENDPAYTKFNGSRNLYSGDVVKTNSQYTADTFLADYGKANYDDIEFQQRNKAEWGEACATHAKEVQLIAKLGKEAIAVTDYATTDEAEDYAETGKALFQADAYSSRLSYDTPAIRGKFMTELARMVYYEPATAAYLVGIVAQRQPTTQALAGPCNAPLQGK